MTLRRKLGARIARLPPRQKQMIDAVYSLLPIPPAWVYNADGLATIHYSPFLEDVEFARLYDEMVQDWFRDELVDNRWRMWLMTRYALQASQLPGNFAEFGVYRGGCSWMILSLGCLDPSRRLHLFDTFAGIPEDNLTQRERREGISGRLADTSPDYVENLLSRWNPIPRLWPGDVFVTFPAADTGDLAFVHLDLNASAPTLHVLEHVYDRLVPGGVVVFDDYGWRAYEDQRRVIDAFLGERPEILIALPTGQGVMTKAP